MLVDFNTTDDQSRIWIYAAEQKLTNEQENHILKSISDHLQNWEAHKVPLTAGVTILEHHFIIIALDETLATGTVKQAIKTLVEKTIPPTKDCDGCIKIETMQFQTSQKNNRLSELRPRLSLFQ